MDRTLDRRPRACENELEREVLEKSGKDPTNRPGRLIVHCRRTSRRDPFAWIDLPVRPGVYGVLAIIPAALVGLPDAETARYLTIAAVWVVTIILWWRALRRKQK